MAIVINGSGTVTGLAVGGLPDGTVDAGTLATDSVSLTEMASGTDGNIISYDASGNPVAIATGSDGQVLTSTGAGSPPAFEALPAGRILQIVQANGTTHTDASQNQNAFTDTVVTAAITPASTSNKIFVSYRIAVHFTDSSNDGGYALRCKRAIASGSTTDNVASLSTYNNGNAHSAFFMNTSTGNDYNHIHTITGVDSPSATTAVTYTVGVASYNIGGSEFQAGGQYSSRWNMLLMEIEG